jgi:peptidyl-prolyl cis-trans isomerase C
MLRSVICIALAIAVNLEIARADEAPTPKRAPKLSDLFGDEVIARGKGVQVKRSQLEDALTAFQATLAIRGQQMPEAQRPYQESQLLQQLIVTQILTNRVTAADQKRVAEFAAEYIADAKKSATSDDAFRRQLKAMGVTPEQFERRVQEQAYVKAVIERDVAGSIQITDAQVKEFYDKGNDVLVSVMLGDLAKVQKDPAAPPTLAGQITNRIAEVRRRNLTRLEQPERVKVSHIFMLTQDRQTEEPLPIEQRQFKRQQLDKIRQRALAGEDFSKLVQEHSEDRSVKQTKGEYTFSREDPFSMEFKAAAFSLELGKISDVVIAPNGLHLIKLMEKLPATKVEFAKVAPDLKSFLKEQEVQRVLPEFFARLTKEAGIEILDPKFRIVENSPPAAK